MAEIERKQETTKTKNKKSWKQHLTGVLFGVLFIVGMGIFFYPTIADLWNNYRQRQLIVEYDGVIKEIPKEDYTQIWEEAVEYNKQHRVNVIQDAFEHMEDGTEDETSSELKEDTKEEDRLNNPYYKLLNPSGNMIMGYIEIPKINVKLPIYHGVGEDALSNGCGHIEGTSLPTGGIGNHTVLSAHRGLPTAKLFTDLDQIEEGDLFIISVLGNKMAYKVDQILTVEPSETDALAIDEKKDLATLVTCTPYGINSHRLLVRGERTEYKEEELPVVHNTVRNPMEGMDFKQKMLVIGGLAFIFAMLVMSIGFKISDKRKAKRKDEEQNHSS